MNVQVQGSNSFTVSERMKNYIKKRASKLSFFKGHINDLVFSLNSEKHTFKVEARFNMPRFGQYNFEANANEMYTAIDKIIHKMDVKINREKNRIQDHSGSSSADKVDFYYEHDKNMPEPTRDVRINEKPTTLIDAFLQMKEEHIEFLGFNFINDEGKVAPGFLRKVDDDILYLFDRKDSDNYEVWSIKDEGKNVKKQKVEMIIPVKMAALIDAQKRIMDQDFHYDVYVDKNDDKLSLLFKEDNGKWIRIF